MKVNVCNLRKESFSEDFIQSVVNTGFAVITHHGIDFSLIKENQDVWRQFFLKPESEKYLYINKEDPNMGFKRFMGEKAVGAKKADLKEFYHWKPGQEIPTEVLMNTQRMFFMLEDVANQILSIIDNHSNGSQQKYQNACDRSDNTIIRALYYPAINGIDQEGAVRAAAHQDINFITLLVAASSSGLQVMDKKGKWHDVPHEENSIVVNIGDMLELASGGLYKSTTHRVINPSDSSKDRISMPMFVHPHSETLLVEGITAQQYLNQRLEQIYLKG